MRYNFFKGLFAGVVLLSGMCLMGLTQLIVLQTAPLLADNFALLVWFGMFIIVCSSERQFFIQLPEIEFPCSKPVMIRQPIFSSPQVWLFIAPVLLFWGLSFSQCYLAFDRQRIALACTYYDYLTEWGDWADYPVLESQRQAVLLLYRLNLIRISSRFGKLQIKVKASEG